MADFNPTPEQAWAIAYGIRRPQAAPVVEDDWTNTYDELVGSEKAYPTWIRGVINDPTPAKNGVYVCISADPEGELPSVWQRLATIQMVQQLLEQIQATEALGSRILFGTTAPVLDDGVTGDIYINSATWQVFERLEDSWANKGSLRGGKGEDGDPGRSQQWVLTQGPPGLELGEAGDLGLDLSTADVYQHLGDEWAKTTLNLKGGKGEDGDTGGRGRTPRILTGVAAPSITLGEEGDFYIRYNGQMYGRTDEAWESQGQLTIVGGPSDGNGGGGTGIVAVYYGATTPAQHTGFPEVIPTSALYIDQTAGDLYTYAAGSWVFMLKLKGDKGDKGDKGNSVKGDKGEPGASAYQVAVARGFAGSEDEWLESIHGGKGDTGDPGRTISHFFQNNPPAEGLGIDGDEFVDLSSSLWDFYIRESGVWNVKGKLRGAAGRTPQLLFGAGAPTADQGQPGDVYTCIGTSLADPLRGNQYSKINTTTWELKLNILGGKFEQTEDEAGTEAKLTEAITVALGGEHIGGINDGEVLAKDLEFTAFVKKLAVRAIYPTYTPSVLQLQQSAPAVGEEGESIANTLTATFTKNDAGNLSAVRVYRDLTQVANGAGTTSPFSPPPVQMVRSLSAVSLYAKADYAAGAPKNIVTGSTTTPDNRVPQVQNPNTPQAAQNDLVSNGLTFVGYRYIFFGPSGSAAPTNSAGGRGLLYKQFITSLSGQLLTDTTSTVFVILVPPGYVLSQVIDVDNAGTNITSAYQARTPFSITNGGGLGSAVAGYTPYVLTVGAPYTSAARHNFTLTPG